MSGLRLRYYLFIVLVEDHDSMCTVPMDSNDVVLSAFLKRYIQEAWMLVDMHPGGIMLEACSFEGHQDV